MGLDVIGAGFGRTGTLSLKTALERLGFAGCYHMFEVFAHPEHADTWTRAARGEAVDWASLMAGYRATVDWPACEFWRQLLDAFPDAKVLLSVRPADRWYESFHETIERVLTMPRPGGDAGAFSAIAEMGDVTVLQRSFAGRVGDRDHVIACFERHNDEVRQSVPPDRLLEFDVTEGWEPLCAFLGVPVPGDPFPNVNDRAFFQSMFQLDPGGS